MRRRPASRCRRPRRCRPSDRPRRGQSTCFQSATLLGGGEGEGELCARGRSLAPTAEAGWLAGSVKVDMKRPDKAEKCGHGTNIGFNNFWRLARLIAMWSRFSNHAIKLVKSRTIKQTKRFSPNAQTNQSKQSRPSNRRPNRQTGKPNRQTGEPNRQTGKPNLARKPNRENIKLNHQNIKLNV